MDGAIKRTSFSRRTLLKGAAIGAAGAAASSVVGPTSLRRSAAAQDQTTVRLTGNPSSPVETELVANLVEQFESQNPTIKVSWEPIQAEYPTKLQTDIAAGTVADVFYITEMVAPDLMSTGVLLPIDDYMAQSGVKAEDFYPGLI